MECKPEVSTGLLWKRLGSPNDIIQHLQRPSIFPTQPERVGQHNGRQLSNAPFYDLLLLH